MTSFYKLSGAGNDFLALVEPEEEPTPEAIRTWCARGVSLGADGLFTLARTESGGARMIHYNADGGRAELCVNGTRCAARLAFHLGWARDAIDIKTDSGAITAIGEDAASVALDLPTPAAGPEPTTLDLAGRPIDGWWMVVGGPHFVIAWEHSLEDAPLADLGPPLRAHDALGPAGANVHWVDFAAPDRLGIRSFERGVESETLACGSGVLAAAAVGLSTGRVALPVEATTRGGFVLRVDGRAEGDRLVSWSLAGDARLLAEGLLMPEASTIPAPPDWQ